MPGGLMTLSLGAQVARFDVKRRKTDRLASTALIADYISVPSYQRHIIRSIDVLCVVLSVRRLGSGKTSAAERIPSVTD